MSGNSDNTGLIIGLVLIFIILIGAGIYYVSSNSSDIEVNVDATATAGSVANTTTGSGSDTTGSGSDTTGSGSDTTGSGSDTTGSGTTDTTGSGTTDTTTTPNNTITAYDSYKSSDYMINELKNTSFGVSANDDGNLYYSFKGNELNVCSDDSTCGGIKISENTLTLGSIKSRELCFGDICYKTEDITKVAANDYTELGLLVRTTDNEITNITFNDDDINLTNYNLQSDAAGKTISRILVNPGVEIRNIDAAGKILNSFRNNSPKPIIILNSKVYGTDTTVIADYIPSDLDTDSIYIAPLDNTITAFFT